MNFPQHLLCSTSSLLRCTWGECKELHCLERWFAQQQLVHFCSTSILLLYEGHDAQEEGDGMVSGESNGDQVTGHHHSLRYRAEAGDDKLRVRVYLVDFAHALPPGEKDLDHNFLDGLRSLITTLQKLLRGEYEAPLNVEPSASSGFENVSEANTSES
ncbi:hypothetical protein CYMTET_29304 [Cymbomonas tetramitiformis]|uniref:Inositol polyphosphate multikinase n=1 Tax=Cymbomonas tetramitiformis TaxID=36881 RepID=A0AAE0FLB7_9CHLO|nr:hypothetical protein CYMTET_29304 [Cymbomonas tetramitiformis]